MKVIGITGGIGSGKSVVLNLLKNEYRAHIVETDKLAHKLMEPGGELFDKIIDYFGKDIINEDGTLNREKLGNIVFRDEAKLKKLNNIVHPGVKSYIKNDIAHKNSQGNILLYVIESAILIETGLNRICDESWYIYVEKEERIRRLIKGRGACREKWLNVMENQQDEDFYQRNCEQVINNSGNLEQTANIVKELLSSFV
ncbi:MAG: dephospho-CoA kinase [Lachnospiraceae bacterium]